MRSAGPLTRLKRTSTPARVPAVASWSQAHGRALSEGGAVRHCGMKQKRPKRWFAPVWWVSLYKWAGRLTQVMLELHLTTRAHHTEQIVCETCPAPAGRVRAVMGWHKWAGRCLEPAEAARHRWGRCAALWSRMIPCIPCIWPLGPGLTLNCAGNFVFPSKRILVQNASEQGEQGEHSCSLIWFSLESYSLASDLYP